MTKPTTPSNSSDWHRFQFDLSVDTPVNWDRFDVHKWARQIARYTAALMCLTDYPEDTNFDDIEAVKALIMNMSVGKIKFVDDQLLHEMIDKTLEE